MFSLFYSIFLICCPSTYNHPTISALLSTYLSNIQRYLLPSYYNYPIMCSLYKLCLSAVGSSNSTLMSLFVPVVVPRVSPIQSLAKLPMDHRATAPLPFPRVEETIAINGSNIYDIVKAFELSTNFNSFIVF